MSLICGACHNVFHPVTNTKIARTYEEWNGSIYAENNIQCQDCHMVPPIMVTEVARSMRKPMMPGSTSNFDTFRTPFYPHTFSGANVPIPELMGAKDHAELNKTLLQLAASISIDYVNYDSGAKTLAVEVIVKNERAGHNLPTGMTEIRQMWVQLILTGADDGDVTVYESGWLDEAGKLDPDANRFGAHAVDKDGATTWKPWRVEEIISDNTIPPKRSARLKYSVKLDEGQGPVRITAKLRYRSFPQALADQYLPQYKLKVPVITMASDSLIFGGKSSEQ